MMEASVAQDRNGDEGGRHLDRQSQNNVNNDKNDELRPWRTEGLPETDGPPLPPRWGRIFAWMAGAWLLFFLIFSFQDQAASHSATVSYTDFSEQVAEGNGEAVFSRGQTIEGELIEAAPVPDNEGATYTQFVTERPTFANDDLLAELEDQGTVVSASPIVQERGTLANLFFSFLPIILIVLFWV